MGRESSYAKIIQGGQANIVVALVNPLTKQPFDLTGCTALSTCFANTAGDELMLTLTAGISILNAPFGRLQIQISAAQTTLMKVVDMGILELSLTFAGDPIKVQIPNGYRVLQSQC